ncbi:MAG TPA: hypothetical protein VFN11_20530 [Ktedonobacterales bacterium]|nr:hypothetical protein [Ktedonobacterales bacterium]
MSRQKYGRWWPWLVVGIVVITLGIPVYATVRGQSARPTVTVTVNHSLIVGHSHFAPGITYTDNSLVYPWENNDPTAIENAKSLMSSAVKFQNTPIMAGGLPDLWPDPSTNEPTNWGALDQRLQLIVSTRGVPVITLNAAPWWMMGQLQSDGTTLLLTRSDEWDERAYASRILDDQMDGWLHLVKRVAERYMASPYNVRYFQVWNGLNGYYNPRADDYDYSTSAGNPAGSNATHGYTYMYNRVFDTLTTVATSLGIPQTELKVGGPSPQVNTWSSRVQSKPSSLKKSYGRFDQRPLDAIKYWLQNKQGASFITVDANNTNLDNINRASASDAAAKFADIVRWIRSLDNRDYPGATSLPIWLGQWYARPFKDWSNNNHCNAIETYAMMEFMKAGGAVALDGGESDVNRGESRLWTDTVKGGGAALPFYYSYRDFNLYFPAGTALYKTTISTPAQVDALASATVVMLVNRTSLTTVVHVDSTTQLLAPYEVAIVNLSALH